LPESQDIPASGVRIGRSHEISPIPGYAVMAGECLLNDPRNSRRLGLSPGSRPPLAFASLVLGIDSLQPFAIQRQDRGGCCLFLDNRAANPNRLAPKSVSLPNKCTRKHRPQDHLK
jgi:hypothetical protein